MSKIIHKVIKNITVKKKIIIYFLTDLIKHASPYINHVNHVIYVYVYSNITI